MPLQRRRPVPLVPLPNLDELSEDTPVFYLKATGEIFLDYESYSSRLSFLLSRTFQCEYSGKSHLDYFTALQSEKSESKIVRERFPDELKGRVLGSVQLQVMGRLDKLVELVYDRYKDRYFVGEKVFVDLSGDKYYARIAKVFPPQVIRDNHQASLASTASSSTTPAPASDDYASVTHKIGTDLNVEVKKSKTLDPAEEYLYTVQLMDEEHKFEGSFMEVKQRTLSRDRLTFSKSILKRYIRECVQRDNSVSSPWLVKPVIARAFGIESVQAEVTEEKDKDVKEGNVNKRKKALPGADAGASNEAGTNKRRKTIDDSTPKPATEGPKKAVKYPIEDLDLDPRSIHDGRVLRRTKTEVPDLPTKPLSRRTLPVEGEGNFDAFLESWNMLNTFSKPLSLSPFTIDDYAGALSHDTREPGQDCVLLAEIHASLTNIIGTDASRVLGSSSIAGTVLAHGGGGAISGKGGDEEGSVKRENGDETPRGGGTPAPDEGKGEDEEEVDELDDSAEGPLKAEALTPEEIFFGKLIRKGIQYGKRWDRQAKLKSDTGRQGWERHLIGAMCQRGGPYYLDNFVEIMRHLFKSDRLIRENGQGEEEGDGDESMDGANGSKKNGNEVPKSSQLSEINDEESSEIGDGPSPEDQYLTLPLEDKLAIINYLITLVMGSKPIRAYLEEADKELTDLRKQRADVNKERRALQEQKLNEGKKQSKTDTNGKSASPSTSTTAATDSRKSPAPSASRATSPSARNGGAGGEDEDEDQLVESDAESSIAPSEAGSTTASNRQAQREEALAQKRLSKLASTTGKPAASKSTTAKSSKGKGKSTLSLDEQLEENALLDDFVEKQFRRYLGVSRCRPLGKDRFHCRYWWFDGIGGMEISKGKDDGSRVPYSTGRIFVQGPSEQDWEVLADDKGDGDDIEAKKRSLVARRIHEEVVEKEQALVGVGEWGYYETPEELDLLLAWLNAKGTRELALRNTIIRWRDYIVAGSEERRKDLENPSRPRYDPAVTSSGRPSRQKTENELPSTYLGYRNQWKKY